MAQGLFGPSPEEIQAAQQAQAMEQAAAYGRMTPQQQAATSLHFGGNQLGGAIGGLLGGVDPAVAKAKEQAANMSGIDLSTPAGLRAAARLMQQSGDSARALGLVQQAMKMESDALALKKTAREVANGELEDQRLETIRLELQKLGDDPTEEQILKVLTKHGNPDQVLKALSQAAQKREAIAAREKELTMKLEAQKEEKEKNREHALEIQRMQNENKLAVRELANAVAGGMNDLKRLNLQGQIDKRNREIQEGISRQQMGFITAEYKADSMLELIESDIMPNINVLTAGPAALTKAVPGTPAYKLKEALGTLTGDKALIVMAEMKANSPHGATGFGQLSEKELALLERQIRSLDQGLGPVQLEKNLRVIQKTYLRAKRIAKMGYEWMQRNPDGKPISMEQAKKFIDTGKWDDGSPVEGAAPAEQAPAAAAKPAPIKFGTLRAN